MIAVVSVGGCCPSLHELRYIHSRESFYGFDFVQSFCSHVVNPCPSTRILPPLVAHRSPPLGKMAWIKHVFSRKTPVVQPLLHHQLAPPPSSPKRCHWYGWRKQIVWVVLAFSLIDQVDRSIYRWLHVPLVTYFLFISPWQRDKAGTPGLKSSTPTPRGDSTPGPSSTPGIRPSLSKPPSMEIPHPPSKHKDL